MKKEEEKIILNFWETYKGVIKKTYVHAKEGHLNFLTYLQIVEDSHFDPTKYKKIFENVPEYAQDSILEFLNTDRENFVARFKKAIIAYRQEISRVETEEIE